MEHLILPPARTQARSTPLSPRVPVLGERQPTASLFGLRKGDPVRGFVREVRNASVRIELMSGVCGWAHGQGLNLDGDQQPCDWYQAGDLVTAEVAGLDIGSKCVTLSIRTRLCRSHWQWQAPTTARPPHSPLDRLHRGSRVWAIVQAVEKNGLRVVADSAPGWIDRRSANLAGKSVFADKYRAGQLITVWVTGVNHDGGEFHAQVNPLPSPPMAGNWGELLP